MKKTVWCVLAVMLVVATGISQVKTGKVVFGYLTYEDVKWPGLSTGTIPADSLPWDVMSHSTLFAADGAIPIPSRYLNQLGPMATYAHAKGTYAGLCYGGSGDAALRAMIADPTKWRAWIVYNLGLIDTKKLDFIELDIEGSATLSNMQGFMKQFYDSLQTRRSTLNPSIPPYIVLTVGGSRAVSWVSLKAYTKQLNLMSYDYIGDWWCRAIHDCSVRSRQFWNGTGNIVDYFAGCGVNSEAPSLQKVALSAINAGWPKDKVVVGFDANPTYYGNGITYIKQPNVSGMTYAGSAPQFRNVWPTIAAAVSAGALKFDSVSYAYSAYYNGQLWTMATLPGNDKGVWAARQVVDSMGLAGVMFWNFGSEIWSTSSVPPGGRGWFYSQVRKHFKQESTPPPPIVDTDGDGVPDSEDECPTLPGPVLYNGCPITPPPTSTCNYDSARNWGFILGYNAYRQDSTAIYNAGFSAGRASVNIDSIATANYNKGWNDYRSATPSTVTGTVSLPVPKLAPKP